MSSPRAARHPVRTAFWIVTGAATIGMVNVLASAVAFQHFNEVLGTGALAANLEGVDEARTRMVIQVVLACVITMILAPTAMLLPRPRVYTRTVVGAALAASALLSLFVIVYSPDGVLSGDESNAYIQQSIMELVPLWYSSTQSLVTTLVIIGCGIAAVQISKEASTDYYQRNDPASAWPGFVSWVVIGRRASR